MQVSQNLALSTWAKCKVGLGEPGKSQIFTFSAGGLFIGHSSLELS